MEPIFYVTVDEWYWLVLCFDSQGGIGPAGPLSHSSLQVGIFLALRSGSQTHTRWPVCLHRQIKSSSYFLDIMWMSLYSQYFVASKKCPHLFQTLEHCVECKNCYKISPTKIEHLQRKLECQIHGYLYLIGSNWNLICPLKRVQSKSLNKQSFPCGKPVMSAGK